MTIKNSIFNIMSLLHRNLFQMQMLLILAAFLCLPCGIERAFAQEMSVSDFHWEENDNTASDDATALEDAMNGDLCAVIKVFTKEKDFVFDFGQLGYEKIVDDKPGEIWIYVPFGVRKMHISHEKFGNCHYSIDIAIESGKTYVMTLVTEGGNINEGNQEVLITCQPARSTLYIDDREITLNGGTYKARLSIGSHSFEVKCPGYVTRMGSFNVDAAAPFVITYKLPREGEDSNSGEGYDEPKKTFVIPGTNVKFSMILVKGTRFSQGATPEQDDAQSDEKPVHFTTLNSYYIGETEVTQELWETIMSDNPSQFKGKELPVEQVSYANCQIFINQLSRILGQKFRMPTEAEWELAARGGKDGTVNKFSGSPMLSNCGWYRENSEGTTHIVATKEPNELGIYDMSGNVREWCSDFFSDYDSDAHINPKGAGTGSHHVCRGGSWMSMPWNCRTSYRDINPPGNTDAVTGLRLAM